MLMVLFAILAGLQVSHATPPGSGDLCPDVGEYDLYGNEGFCVAYPRCDEAHPCGNNEECTEGIRLCMKALDDFDATNPSQAYGACSANGRCSSDRICVEASRCFRKATPVNVEAPATPAPPREPAPEPPPSKESKGTGKWAWIIGVAVGLLAIGFAARKRG